MPPVSEAQRRAMYAAANGKSTLGIPQSVGKEFVGEDVENKHAAGVVHISPQGKVLLMLRSPNEKNYGAHWGLPGGKAEDGETPEEAARREVKEETGYDNQGQLKLINRVKTPTGMIFTTFAAPVENEFRPKMEDGEHTDFTWANLSDLPRPLHPNVEKVLRAANTANDDIDEFWPDYERAGELWTLGGLKARLPELSTANIRDLIASGAQDSITFDKASVRDYDADGRLHVALTNISKANVCHYMGREIPYWEKLGLDPDKTYRLWRHPDELAKAASTFNGVPLLEEHVPTSADDHPHDKVVGAAGNEAVFDAPYLKNSLVVWPSDSIEAIKNGKQRELSCGYYYRPDMTPGVTPDGEAYDGVMRDINGNHIAVVPEGRAGPDVVVGDSKTGMDEMAKRPPRKAASKAREAVNAYLRTHIAADASIGDLTQLLDCLEGDGNMEAELPAKKEEELPKADTEMVDPIPDEEPHAKVKAFLGGKLSDEDMAMLFKLLEEEGKLGAEHETQEMSAVGDEEEEKPPFPPKKEEKEEDMVTKGAMDAAMRQAEVRAEARTMARLNGIREAERAVKPLIGEVALGLDSADAIYAAALKAHSVNTAGVNSAGLRSMVAMLAKSKTEAAKPTSREMPAMDAANASSFLEMFPEAARIRL